MHSIQDIIKEACQARTKGVLVTITHIDGSAYQKPGTIMLFSHCGLRMGLISGGCLEDDLAHRVQSLMDNTDIRSQRISYDMTAEDDLGWGRGAGCNGVVHLLLEKIDATLKFQLKKIVTLLNRGVTVHLIREIIPETQPNKRSIQNNLEPVSVNLTVIAQEHEFPEIYFRPGLSATWIKETVLVQQIEPKSRLIIFGAGVDVRPLAAIASQMGFTVIVWDWRKQFLKQSFFPDATLLNESSIMEAIRLAEIGAGDYVVIMTHDFQRDWEILRCMLQIDGLGYLGILGPKRRTERLINGTIPSHIHSPVGLAINAEGPREIAISIIAELIAVKRGKQIEEDYAFEKDTYYRDLFSSGK